MRRLTEACEEKASRTLAMTVALAVAVTMIVITKPAEATSKPVCGKSLQAMVDDASSGAVLEVPGGCIYRETVIIDKPLTLIAKPGAEIRGSDVWEDWSQSGAYWKKGPYPELGVMGRWVCEGTTKQCLWPEQVYMDGKPLEQVEGSPRSGQFSLDHNRNVVLADDPTGHTVEVTVRDRWVRGHAPNVTIQGFTMRHSAGDGIKNDLKSGWVVKDCELSHAHASNLGLSKGTGLKALNNELHHGGQLGFASNSAEIELRGNVIHNNNTEDFATHWEAGGAKITSAVVATIDKNRIYRNNAMGLWTDTPSRTQKVAISNNRVHHNPGDGIRVEATKNIKVFGNVVFENGWGMGDGYSGAGIALSASHNANVYDNVSAWNNNGVTVINVDRKPGQENYDRVRRVIVKENTILHEHRPGMSTRSALAWVKAYAGGNIYKPAAKNRGYANRYWYPSSESSKVRYRWSSPYTRLGKFNKTRGEERGRYMTRTEKNRVVAAKDIPASP